MPAVGRLREPGRTLFLDLKHIISLDLLVKLFKCPNVGYNIKCDVSVIYYSLLVFFVSAQM